MIRQRLIDLIKRWRQKFSTQNKLQPETEETDLNRLVPVLAPPLYSLLNLPGENKAEKPLKCPVRIPYNLWVPLYSNEMQDSSLQQGETIIKVIKVRFTSDSKNFYHNLWFSNPYIVAIRCRRPFIFKHMYSVGSNNQRLKYHSCLHHQVAKIWGIENRNLWRKHNSFFIFLLITSFSE